MLQKARQLASADELGQLHDQFMRLAQEIAKALALRDRLARVEPRIERIFVAKRCP